MPRKGQPIASAPLRKGGVFYRLCRDLAAGEMNQTELARKHGVSKSAITQFKQRNAEEIERIRADLGNAYSGLWVADKANRVAEYQADIDTINAAQTEELARALQTYMNAGEDEEEKNQRAVEIVEIMRGIANGSLTKIKHRALRQVAEELGQLPARVQVNVSQPTTYVVHGVDTGDLT